MYTFQQIYINKNQRLFVCPQCAPKSDYDETLAGCSGVTHEDFSLEKYKLTYYIPTVV